MPFNMLSYGNTTDEGSQGFNQDEGRVNRNLLRRKEIQCFHGIVCKHKENTR